MTKVVCAMSSRGRSAAGLLILAGIVLGTLTDAIASTVLSFGRGYMVGDTHTTPDEFAWLDTGYTALKLIGLLVTPWLMQRVDACRLVIGSTLVMGAACGITAISVRFDLLITLRIVQGFSGALVLIEARRSCFTLVRGPSSRSFKRCLRWDR